MSLILPMPRPHDEQNRAVADFPQIHLPNRLATLQTSGVPNFRSTSASRDEVGDLSGLVRVRFHALQRFFDIEPLFAGKFRGSERLLELLGGLSSVSQARVGLPEKDVEHAG